jgi:4-amino-4-deoxy-L-arabinose transferase-like glycosyltransferase
VLICGFAVLHAVNLSADFPNHSPWFGDWAKYTDEGWYGNAAIRAHLFGDWYLPGDFNPAPAVPVWPFLEWLLFFFTGVSLSAARGLAVAFFFANLCLSYLLLRTRGAAWVGLLALTLLVTSPFLYCFSRLAILEPMLIAFTLAALNLAIRLSKFRRPIGTSIAIGLLFTLMMLTKTTAVFLLPALGWAMLQPLGKRRDLAIRCAAAAAATSAVSFGIWMGIVVGSGHLADYRYLFYINTYPKPANLNWPLMSLWWSFHGGLWVDHILIPLAGLVTLGVLLNWLVAAGSTGKKPSSGWRNWGESLRNNPTFGASVLAVAGYIVFMTWQNHPQPRYFAVVAVFCFFLIAQGAAALLGGTGPQRQLGWALVAITVSAVAVNAAWTLSYAGHPEYTYVSAARGLTRYIDQHPNGKRILVSISGDEITLATHLPTLCDDFGTEPLPAKLARYQPGWYAAWNDLDPGTLADLHTHYSLEQVASFHAFDDPERNVLVLFKLHPLPRGRVRDQHDENLKIPLDDDTIDIPAD